MSWFSRTSGNCSAVIDIGSGSVGVGIVHTDNDSKTPVVLWSHREHLLLTDIADLQDVEKRLQGALLNVFIALTNTGIPTIKAKGLSSTLTDLHVTIGAPWSYTVTKTVSYSDEQPFTVDTKLQRHLAETAENRIEREFATNKTLQSLELEVVERRITDTIINGYKIAKPSGHTGKKLSISLVSVLVKRRLVRKIHELAHDSIPHATLSISSTLLGFYFLLHHDQPNITESCLVDVSREATEIGIVRDGMLKYVTHIPFGSFSLAREIALALSVPKEEAFAYLKNGNESMYDNLTPTQKEEVETIFQRYQQELTDLLHRTGDRLAIPKTVYVHCHPQMSDFFTLQLDSASNTATGGSHGIHLILDELPLAPDASTATITDETLRLAAHFFHTHHNVDDDTRGNALY